MAVIASPPVDWDDPDERYLSAKFDVYSIDATNQIHLTNVVVAVPTFFNVEDDIAAYPIAG